VEGPKSHFAVGWIAGDEKIFRTKLSDGNQSAFNYKCRYVPPQGRLNFNGLHGSISQEI
jgi:hypothetical protein